MIDQPPPPDEPDVPNAHGMVHAGKVERSKAATGKTTDEAGSAKVAPPPKQSSDGVKSKPSDSSRDESTSTAAWVEPVAGGDTQTDSPSRRATKPDRRCAAPPVVAPRAKKPPRQDGATARPPRKKAVAIAQDTASDPYAEPDNPSRDMLELLHETGRLPLRSLVPAWAISMVLHMALIIVLGLIMLPQPTKKDLTALVVFQHEETQTEVEIIEPTTQVIDETQPAIDVVNALASIDIRDKVEFTDTFQITPKRADVDLVEIGFNELVKEDLLSKLGSLPSQTLRDVRSDDARKEAVKTRGGNEQSELAVAKALAWFVQHQYPDGGWSFDHRVYLCRGQCRNPGTLDQARVAATAMALLPFLGAGQSHVDGPYKDNVKAGLAFLIRNMDIGPNGGSLIGGGKMYSHGLATIALCEAYAISYDQALAEPAQLALNFITYAQDQTGGGWRYSPKEPGDTSVVGWQLMALKSGHMAELFVPQQTVAGANHFLNLVQQDAGASYGYMTPGNGPATSAIGLLCRMYLGSGHDHPAVEAGVRRLSEMGPSTNNMYYNYYATQVMHHYEGALWTKWNDQMRDYLIETQAKEGHETGSWHFSGGHSSSGGRVYNTSLAAMTLEVYYRHMPLYSKKSMTDKFDDQEEEPQPRQPPQPKQQQKQPQRPK